VPSRSRCDGILAPPLRREITLVAPAHELTPGEEDFVGMRCTESSVPRLAQAFQLTAKRRGVLGGMRGDLPAYPPAARGWRWLAPELIGFIGGLAEIQKARTSSSKRASYLAVICWRQSGTVWL